MIAAILLAAGRASRYGREKLLEVFEGETLVRRAARAFAGAGCTPLIVVVPPGSALTAQFEGLAPVLVENPDPSLGIARSISLGVLAVPDTAEAVLIGVADQPLISVALVRGLMQAFQPGLIVAPRYGEVRGNPRVYDRRFFAELQSLEGDRGAQILAERHPESVFEVEFPAQYGIDVDTAADWKRLDGSSLSG